MGHLACLSRNYAAPCRTATTFKMPKLHQSFKTPNEGKIQNYNFASAKAPEMIFAFTLWMACILI
jgi:hypothetical protein